MKKNYLEQAARMLLVDNGWKAGEKEFGAADSMFKIEGGSKKEASFKGDDVNFFFMDSSIYTCSINDLLKRTHRLLNYFVEE